MRDLTTAIIGSVLLVLIDTVAILLLWNVCHFNQMFSAPAINLSQAFAAAVAISLFCRRGSEAKV